jgi:hypothetical protein
VEVSTNSVVEILLGLCVTALYTYVRVVAANAAKKRDLDDLTRIVKRVEAQYEHAVFVHRLQAQLEVDAYKNVWDALVLLDRAVIAYGRLPADPQAPSPQQQAAAGEVQKCFTSFTYCIKSWRPFYGEEVYQALGRVAELFGDESIERATLGSWTNADPLVRAAAARSQVEKVIEDVCSAIRSRLRDLVVTDDPVLGPERAVVVVRP